MPGCYRGVADAPQPASALASERDDQQGKEIDAEQGGGRPPQGLTVEGARSFADPGEVVPA
jgi:hypothetical protein